ncbi:hypothetical protein JCM11957_06850 [Caminibacter profundus]
MSLKNNLIDDLDVFFNFDEFGEEVEYNNSLFPAIFIEKSEYLLDDGYLGYSPALIVKKSDFKDIKNGDILKFRDETWYVIKKEQKDELILKLFISKSNSTRF